MSMPPWSVGLSHAHATPVACMTHAIMSSVCVGVPKNRVPFDGVRDARGRMPEAYTRRRPLVLSFPECGGFTDIEPIGLTVMVVALFECCDCWVLSCLVP